MAFRGRESLYIGSYAKVTACVTTLCGILGGFIAYGSLESDARERVGQPVIVVSGVNHAL